jgi:hypothetical protein
MSVEQLYALAAEYLDFLAEQGEEAGMAKLSDAQHTLLAYCYLDSQVQEGGFVQLIAAGYGDYVFANPLADSLRRWGIKATPKVLDKARVLYAEHGGQIEALASEEVDVDALRAQFAAFEDLDGDYYDVADEDLAAAAEYVAAHQAEFALPV